MGVGVRTRHAVDPGQRPASRNPGIGKELPPSVVPAGDNKVEVRGSGEKPGTPQKPGDALQRVDKSKIALLDIGSPVWGPGFNSNPHE